MVNLCLARRRRPAYRRRVLTCRDCGVTSEGAAWHWIALLAPDGVGELEVASYCPRCAESHFGYFSEFRARRDRSEHELLDD